MAQSSAGTALPGELWWFREAWDDVYREAGTEKGTKHYIDGRDVKDARALVALGNGCRSSCFWSSQERSLGATHFWPDSFPVWSSLRGEGGGTIRAPGMGWCWVVLSCDKGCLIRSGWEWHSQQHTQPASCWGYDEDWKGSRAQCWEDLGVCIFLRLTINERINVLFVRELLMWSPPTRSIVCSGQRILWWHMENLSKGGGTLDVGFVQTGWESF